MSPPRRPGRKLLVASLGVAAVSYAAACHGTKEPEQVGNLVAPQPEPSAEQPPPQPEPPETAGNLMAPPEPPPPDAGPRHMVGNLMPPRPPEPPTDAGTPRRKVSR